MELNNLGIGVVQGILGILGTAATTIGIGTYQNIQNNNATLIRVVETTTNISHQVDELDKKIDTNQKKQADLENRITKLEK